MVNETVEVVTLHDALYSWREAPHPKQPGLKNKDRKPNDLANVDKALRCLAVGASNGVSNLELTPIDVLFVNDNLLARYVEKGARLSSEQSQREPPSEKTLKNLIANVRAVRAVVKGGKHKQHAKSPNRRRKEKSKRKHRPRFPRSAWPQTLVAEWPGYAEWKMKPFLSPEEGVRFRSKSCKPTTVESHANHLNSIVGYLVRERGMTDFDLKDLCSVKLYTDYLNWHLQLDADGGHYFAKEVGVTLACISRYQVAKGLIPQEGPDDKDIWDAFYAAGRRAIEVGAERDALPEKKAIGHWKPADLDDMADEAWDKPPPRYWRGDGCKRQMQIMSRLRAGLFFKMAFETPLRLRNFIEMRWGHNLKRTPDGRWQVLFRGEELKVARRGMKTNEYRHVYSRETSRRIDQWREELQKRLGEDFEKTHPNVFVSGRLTPGAMAPDTLRADVKTLSVELRGEELNPHMVRHIIASYLVNQHGPGGLGLAAELLGDTEEVVLKTYYRPNNEETMESYLRLRKRGKESE